MNIRRFIEDSLAERAYIRLLILQRQAGVIEEIARKILRARRAGRSVLASGKAGRGDVRIIRGDSARALEAVRQARKAGAVTIGFAGGNGGRLRKLVDVCLCVPSSKAAVVREGHAAVTRLLEDIVGSSL